MTVLGFSYGTRNLRCIMFDLSLQLTDSLVVVCRLSSCGMWALLLCASHLLGSVFKGWKLCSEREGQGSCPHAAYSLVEEMGTKQVKK